MLIHGPRLVGTGTKCSVEQQKDQIESNMVLITFYTRTVTVSFSSYVLPELQSRLTLEFSQGFSK